MLSFKAILTRGQLAVRSTMDGDDTNSTTSSDSSDKNAVAAMITLLTVVFLGLTLSATLVMLRRMRRRQQMLNAGLPQYNAPHGTTAAGGAGNNNRKGLTIQTTNANGHQSVLVFSRDGQPMLANPHSPPYSPDNVPEIRITFPDEHDEMGRRKSGRVVVVRVGEHNAVGMEPVREDDEQLPAYEKDSKTQFYSIDMDQIGGLKEKTYQ